MSSVHSTNSASPASGELVRNDPSAGLLEAIRAHVKLLETGEQTRKRLAELTKRSKDTWAEVERRWAVCEAVRDDNG